MIIRDTQEARGGIHTSSPNFQMLSGLAVTLACPIPTDRGQNVVQVVC